MENNQIKLMLVEDHDSVRKALCSTLKDTFDFNVICDAANGKEAITLLNTFKPHVILLDVEMPIMNGFEALKIIKEQYSGIKVIMFTAYDGYYLSKQTILRGADAVLLKSINLEQLAANIQMVAAKDMVVKPCNEKLYFENQLPSLGENTIIVNKEPLTEQDIKILKLLCENKTNKQVGEIMNLSVRTIEFHRWRICQKIGAKNLIDMYKYALKYGFVLP